jgi:aminoglycoside phosphotransferase (APT) family kinase protein
MSMLNADAAKGLGDVAVMATQITLDRLGDRMTAQNRETATESMALTTPWLLAEPDRFALMHGDFRLDNVLFNPDRTAITVVDGGRSGEAARDLPTSPRPACCRRPGRLDGSW